MPIGKGDRPPGGQGRDHRRQAAHDVPRAGGGRGRWPKEGIEAEVIDPRTLVPLDKELILESVRKTGRLVIVEEDNLTGGWAAELSRDRGRRGLLLAGRADQARLGAGRAAALRAGPGAVLRAERRAGGGCGEGVE